MAAVDILLATYNGARFLPEQLQSLIDQHFRDWRLIVRDDGSADDTLAISDAPYFAFCDQDDVWKPDKLSRMVACLRQHEATVGAATPLLAFCDLEPVDAP